MAAAPDSGASGPADDSQKSNPKFAPILALCDKIFTSAKGDNNIEVLHVYDELLSLDPQLILDAVDDADVQETLQSAWGRCMLAALRLNGGDEEQLAVMKQDFEDRVGFPSPYLEATRLLGVNTPADVARAYLELHGFASGGVIDGALARFPDASLQDVRDLVALCKERHISITESVTRQLTKRYCQFIRAESGPCTGEDAFEAMLADGVPQAHAILYNTLFMLPQLKKKTTLEWYEDMLRRGVAPQLPTFRILLKYSVLPRELVPMFRRRAAGSTAPEEYHISRLHKYADDGDVAGGREWYRMMRMEGVVPDRQVFHYLISACRRGQASKADEWFDEMTKVQKLEPNQATFTHMMQLVRENIQTTSEHCERYMQLMETFGVQPDTHHYGALLESLVRAHQRVKVQHWFRVLLEKEECNIFTFNIVMKLGPFDWCFGVIAAVLASGLTPTTHSRSTMLGFIRDATSERMFDAIEACGWQRDAILCNADLTHPPKGTYPSLQECLRFMLREIKVEKNTMDRLSSKLVFEIESAKTRQRAAGGGTETPPAQGTTINATALGLHTAASAAVAATVPTATAASADVVAPPPHGNASRGGRGAHGSGPASRQSPAPEQDEPHHAPSHRGGGGGHRGGAAAAHHHDPAEGGFRGGRGGGGGRGGQPTTSFVPPQPRSAEQRGRGGAPSTAPAAPTGADRGGRGGGGPRGGGGGRGYDGGQDRGGRGNRGGR